MQNEPHDWTIEHHNLDIMVLPFYAPRDRNTSTKQKLDLMHTVHWQQIKGSRMKGNISLT